MRWQRGRKFQSARTNYLALGDEVITLMPGVAVWPCDTTYADSCGRTMNGLFDLHLLCITLRGRGARVVDIWNIVHPSSVRSDYTSLFRAKGLLIGSALRFVRLTIDTHLWPVRCADTQRINSTVEQKDGKDQLMLITVRDGR